MKSRKSRFDFRQETILDISQFQQSHVAPNLFELELHVQGLHDEFLKYSIPILISIALYSKKLREITMDVFAMNYRQFNLAREMRYAKTWHLEYIFIYYVRLVKSLTIDGFIFDQENPSARIDTIFCLKQFCFNNTRKRCHIEELVIQRFYEHDIHIRRLYNIFKKLDSVVFYSCSLPDDISIIFNHCRKVEKLKIENCFADPLRIPNNTIQPFIPNERLETLIIRENDNLALSKLISHIHEYAPYLRKLKLSEINLIFHNAINSIAQLSLLQKLSINLCSLTVTPLLKQLRIHSTQIKKLKLQNGHVDCHTVKELSQLTSLKKLTLDDIYGLTNDQLVETLNQLTYLKNLHLKNSPEALDIKTLGKIIKRSPKLQFVKLTFNAFAIETSDYYNLLRVIMQNREKKGIILTLNVISLYNTIPHEIITDNRPWFNIVDISQQ